MARISLRAYNREIESLIDRGHYEQAIAHCRHILKYFNKHTHTYRLLGKTFLESQRYGDAADIFQRVLSSIPDDFVSHVGMSIIREDEGNLDEALWHIERAYEVQPGNKAIQGELRRLYGRKDGMEPPKIQLTRGALARMYLKGELYQQAISELRPALSESQQRPDLLVVLARAYYLSGQKVPAADTCSSLLKKYPYCLEANRILADILADSERAEEANVYLKRAIALDPYISQISSQAPTAEQVPEAAVVLEKLDWSQDAAKAMSTSQPEWASSLGVEVDDLEAKDESMPDWLSSPAAEGEVMADTTQSVIEPPFEEAVEKGEPDDAPFLPEDVADSEEIPGWMKEAGWVPATGELDESVLETDIVEDGITSNELAPADMPDWLQEMAPDLDSTEDTPLPQGELTKEDGDLLPADADVLPWLDEHPPGPTDSVVTFLEDKESKVPDTSEIDLDSDDSVEIPDWLQDFKEEPQLGSDLEEVASPIDAPVGENGEVTVSEELLPVSEDLVPDQQTDPELVLQTTDHFDESEGVQDSETAEELPQWMSDLKDETADESQSEEPTEDIPSEDGVPAWLGVLAAEQVGEALLSTNEESKPEEETAALEDTVWAVDSEEQLTDEPESDIESPEMIETDGGSDWLQEFEASTEDDIADLASVTHAAEELPTELSEPHEETIEAVPAPEDAGEPILEITEPDVATDPDSIDDDEAFAWLESLAEKQGATEAMLLSPDERQKEPPEWVQQASEETSFAAIESVGDEELEGDGEALPDWLSAEAPVAGTFSETQEVSGEPSEELPDWLASDVEDSPFIDSEDDFEQATEIDEEAEAEPESEMPSWIQTGAVAAGAVAIGAALSSSDDDSLDEQDELVDEIDADVVLEQPCETDEDLVVSEDVEVGIPDWLQEVTEAAPTTEAEFDPDADIELGDEVEELVEAQPTEVPDWIKEISPEPVETSMEAEALSTEIEEVIPIPDQPVPTQVSEMLFAPSLLSPEEAEPTPDTAAIEEEDEPIEETLVVDEGPIIEGDTAQTQVIPPDQIPVPLVAPLVAAAAVLPAEEDIDDDIPAFEIPDWLQDIEGEVPPTEETPAYEPTEIDTQVDFKAGGLDDEEVEGAIDEVPEWLSDVGLETPEETLVAADIDIPATEGIAPEIQSEEITESPDEETVLDDDDAFAWLEGLAAKQGAEEALLLSPEDRKEEPPDWVDQEAAESEVLMAEETQPAFDEVEEGTEPVAVLPESDALGVTALDISDEETIPLEELGIDVPDLESILGEQLEDKEVTPQVEPELPESPLSIDDVPADEISTRIDGYAQTQPLPDLSEILGEEPISPIESVTPESIEQPVDSDAEILEQELPDSVETDETLPEVPEPLDTTIEGEPTADVLPELPDWLADVEEEITEEGEVDWAPSEELLAQTGALDDITVDEPGDTQLDINKAGLADFERLPGVGFIKAQAIIEHREVHGPYTNINDLENVPGLGEAMVDDIREFITVETPDEPYAEKPSDENQVTLIQARNSLIKGDNESAVDHYQSLINDEQLLPEVVQDLNDALYRHPMDISIWQTLGDAHVRLGQIQEALDAYTKAEELLR